MKAIRSLAPWFWRGLLFSAILAAIGFAIIIKPPGFLGHPSDAALHAATFVVLTLLARPAYPRASASALFVGLAVFGAGIELVQALPAIARDPSLVEFLIDIAAIAAGLVVTELGRWRSASKQERT